jgi:type VI secretion system protein ImpK
MVGNSPATGRYERNPLMAAMFFASSEILTFASVLPEVAANLPSTTVLRQQIANMFERMKQRAAEVGVTSEDIREAQYPLAAFLDEQILKTQWGGRYEWQQQPLQLQWFGENTAGDNFFERMSVLARQPTRAHVAEVYVLCLAHGFQGRFAMNDAQALQPTLEQASLMLAPALAAAEPLSPKGVRPANIGRLGGEAPVVRLSLVFLGVALVAFILLKVMMSVSASSAEKTMRGATPAIASAGAGAR